MDIGSLMTELLTAEATGIKLGLGSLFGLCLGLTGVGGGVLLIPMLQLFCDMSPVLAVGTASLISALVKINVSVIHVRAKNVSWRQIVLLFIGAVPVTLMVTQLVVYLNNHPEYKETTQSSVAMLVALVMIGSLASVCIKFRSRYHQVNESANGTGTQVLAQITGTQITGTGTTRHKTNGKKALLSGMFCGTVMGSTGVGGGVLLLPILNSVLNIDIKKAIGSSVVLALFLSSVAALGYAKGGQVDVVTALLFVFGSFSGVAIAARLIRQLSEKMTYIITISVISISLLLYLFA
ncbi:sulfite exporter TauE/SafE family protein [Vibrio sp. MA40-2]|uniref:sulfite exporter TauE/SafE family protein n=1 Tax=Vibrio sp. MA40-2 TaxID=3391828 RepID=UPI0039A559F8